MFSLLLKDLISDFYFIPFRKLKSGTTDIYKVYKKLVRKKHRLFKNKLLGNLIENEKKNPKDFWNTVTTLLKSNKGDTSEDVSPDTWIQHFKSLLNMNYADNFPRNDIFNCFGLNNTILNGSISADEIRKSINSLKNGKSSGPDGISNEMLKIPPSSLLKNLLFYSILF